MPRKERRDKGQSKYTPKQKAARSKKFTNRALEEASKRKGAIKPPHKGRYTTEDVEKFTVTPKEQLTKYQRKKVGTLPHEEVTPEEIAKHTGLTEDEIQQAIDRHQRVGLDHKSIVYIPSRGFFGKAANGETVVLYGIRNIDDADDYVIAFGTSRQLENSVATRSGCISPPCTADGTAAEVVLYLKDHNERKNIAS